MRAGDQGWGCRGVGGGGEVLRGGEGGSIEGGGEGGRMKGVQVCRYRGGLSRQHVDRSSPYHAPPPHPALPRGLSPAALQAVPTEVDAV